MDNQDKFLTQMARIDAALGYLEEARENHFCCEPDNVMQSDVIVLEAVADQLEAAMERTSAFMAHK